MSQVSLDVSGIASGQPGVPEPIATAFGALQTGHNDTDNKLTNVTSGHSHNGVDSRRLGNYSRITNRQGGDASAWNIGGTSNYTTDNVFEQCGSITVGTSAGSTAITFPTPFDQAPLIFLMLDTNTVTENATPASVSASGFTIWNSATGLARKCYWRAIGTKA